MSSYSDFVSFGITDPFDGNQRFLGRERNRLDGMVTRLLQLLHISRCQAVGL